MDTKMKRDLKNLMRMLWRKLTGYRRAPTKIENRRTGHVILGRWFRTKQSAERFCLDRGMQTTAIQNCAEKIP